MIWISDGNNAELEIEIHIERCRFYRKRIIDAISDLKSELRITDKSAEEIRDHLHLLRGRISIVSLREFSLLQSKLRSLESQIVAINNEIQKGEIDIDSWNKKIVNLQEEKSRLGSKILEFNRGKKRPKNRK